MHYQTTFTISDQSQFNLAGVKLLNQLRQNLLRSLAMNRHEYNEDYSDNHESGFWEVTAERQTLDASGDTVRLEIRAYTEADQVHVQVLTRYLRIQPDDHELPTHSPKLLQNLARRFHCQAGSTKIRHHAITIDRHNARRFIQHQISNPNRCLPFLAITRDDKGKIPADPHRLQRTIAGAGQVAIIEESAQPALRAAIKRATFNGRMRLINPNLDGRHEYYEHEPELRHLVEQCMLLIPEPEFDQPYSQAVIASRSIQPPPEVPSQTDQQLQQRLDQVLALNAELQNQLNTAQAQPSYTHDNPRNTIPVGNSHIYNITRLNHAINIVRDPLRNHITHMVRVRHHNRAGAVIAKSIDLRNTSYRDIKAAPQRCFDINDMPHIIANNQECFNIHDRRAVEYSRLLRELKVVRNTAAHPPLGGISPQETIDKLRVVQEIVEYLGIMEPTRQIKELIQINAT